LTAYGCTTGIYSGGGIEFTDQVVFDDCVLADNGAHVQFASANVIRNSLFVYDSGNAIYPRGLAINGLDDSYIAGFEDGCAYVVYDGPGRVFDSHFVGYDGSTEATLVFSTFGAARRHTNYLFDGLTFAGPTLPLGIPEVEFTSFATLPTTNVFAHSFVWGIAIRDLDGSLSGGVPVNPNSPYPAGTPHTLVSDHQMMRLVNGAVSADVQTVKMTNAWLSPVPWGHLQVRYFAPNGVFNPSTGLYSVYDPLTIGLLPPTTFTRRTYLGYPGVKYDEDLKPGGEFRQMPVIVRSGGSAVAQCEYEVLVHSVASPPTGAGRVDISLDDAVAGDTIRLLITHPGLPNWTPFLAVRVQTDASVVHTTGQDPNSLPALPPSPPGTATTWQLGLVGTLQAVDLRLVVPPASRTHRITITW
jgi:hypothetical protein